MIFSISAEYSLKTLIYMTEHRDQKFFNVTELAEKVGSSKTYLSKVLKQLVHHKLLNSKTGPGKGYSLKKDPDKIYLLDVLKATNQTAKLKQCVLGYSICGDENPCPFHTKFEKFRTTLVEYINDTNLTQANKNGWPKLSK